MATIADLKARWATMCEDYRVQIALIESGRLTLRRGNEIDNENALRILNDQLDRLEDLQRKYIDTS
jgi:hypothetical protein